MEIAILGWGSLIPHPTKHGATLQIRGEWHEDGPLLPIEYARISETQELTLVLYPEAQNVQTLWAYSALTELDDAIKNLRDREDTSTRRIGYINLIDGSHSCNAYPEALYIIMSWAEERELDAIIWTDLSENFQDKLGVDFSEDAAIGYLNGLKGKTRDEAKKYIQETPKQVKTHLRPRIKQELKW